MDQRQAEYRLSNLEPFYMVDKSRSRKQHGAGLGLALVSKIADLHGTRLEIESDGKTGTAVSMVFEGAQGDWDEKDI